MKVYIAVSKKDNDNYRFYFKVEGDTSEIDFLKSTSRNYYIRYSMLEDFLMDNGINPGDEFASMRGYVVFAYNLSITRNRIINRQIEEASVQVSINDFSDSRKEYVRAFLELIKDDPERFLEFYKSKNILDIGGEVPDIKSNSIEIAFDEYPFDNLVSDESITSDINVLFNGAIIDDGSGNSYLLSVKRIDKEPFLNGLKQQVLSIVNSKVKSVELTYKEQIHFLKRYIERIKKIKFNEEMSRVLNAVSRGWKLDSSGQYLIYGKKIIPKTILYHGNRYVIDPDNNPFFVNKPRIKIEDRIGGAVSSSAFHPNVERRRNGSICLGTLNRRPILEVLETLPTLLEEINLDSAFGNDAESKAKYLIEAGLAPVVGEMEVFHA